MDTHSALKKAARRKGAARCGYVFDCAARGVCTRWVEVNGAAEWVRFESDDETGIVICTGIE